MNVRKTGSGAHSRIFLLLPPLWISWILVVSSLSWTKIFAINNSEHGELILINDNVDDIQILTQTTTIDGGPKKDAINNFSFLHAKEECQPRHIHLSPGDSVPSAESDVGAIGQSHSSLTVSFTLPFHISQCHPSKSIPSVVYGFLAPNQESIGENGSSGDEQQGKEEGRVYPIENNNDDVRQYNITSVGQSDGMYESDWIYHLHITGLKSGGIDYWYRIEVEERKDIATTTMAIKQGNSDAGNYEEKEDNVMAGWLNSPNDIMEEGGIASSTTVGTLQKGLGSSVRSEKSNHLRHHSSVGEEFAKETDPVLASLPEENETVSLSNNTADDVRKIIASSPNLTFRTPPYPGSPEPVRIAMVGDLGQTENSSLTISHMLNSTYYSSSIKSNPTSLMLIAGDLSYANSDQTMWPTWFDLIEPLVRHTPLAVAAGNHEEEYDADSNRKFTAYENWFRMPNRIKQAVFESHEDMEKKERRKLVNWWGGWNRWGWWGWWWGDISAIAQLFEHYKYDYGNSYYAFTHGMVRIITLNSYTDTSRGSKQYRWLQSELKTLDRNVTPWVVVMFHAPLYTSFNSHVHEKEPMRMKKAMEHLFVVYRINLIMCGHDHAYMRTHPVFFGSRDSSGKAPVYVTVGAGGNREKLVKGYLRLEPESWVAARDRFDYGFGELHVLNATSARWRFVRDATTTEGIRDNVWLTNQYFL